MARAAELAARGLGHVRPNPAVGAVVVKGGRIVGEGFHARAGSDHAEAAALKAAGAAARGAVVYCTLEPCSRPGRVGACTDALVAAGVRRVEWLCADPNPVNGRRAARILRRAGIETACWEKLRGRAAARLVARGRALIAPFAKRVATALPFVTVKIAMSLDGRICDDAGRARWISSEGARRLTGGLRERVDAVMVGAETVRRDDPSLLSHGTDNPDLLRVVVTRTGKNLPQTAQVFADAARARTFVLCVGAASVPARLRAWTAELGGVFAGRTLADALRAFAAATGAQHVLCEGGLKLARSLADAGLADEWLSVLAPIVVGSRPLAEAARLKLDHWWGMFEDGLEDDVMGLYRGRWGCSPV